MPQYDSPMTTIKDDEEEDLDKLGIFHRHRVLVDKDLAMLKKKSQDRVQRKDILHLTDK